MRISNLNINKENIYKDGEFQYLAQCTVRNLSGILTFYEDEKFLDEVIKNNCIKAIICKLEHIKYFQNSDLAIIISETPRITFFEIHNFLSSIIKREEKISVISKNSKISDSAKISKFNVEIGENVIIEDNVIIHENVKIGDNSILRVGCVVGGQGFEYKKFGAEKILSVKHIGSTEIGQYVELKEYVTVHRALFNWDSTSIDDYSKIDSHSHVAHGTKIGSRVFIGSGTNLAGNIKIGDNVYIGPNVTISNRLKISNNARVSIGSVVTKDVLEGQVVTGNFAIPHNLFIKKLKESK